MIAAKQYDMIMGIDIHIIQPPGPVPPIPIPHPFIGMVWDPMQFIPFIGADVWVNGMPGAVAGDEGKALPPHIPMGGTFIKPIDNECEVFMGSATVTINGEPMSRLGMPVLSCSCIGMPSPPRPSKKDSGAGLKLPTSTLIAIPSGQLVLVGGPPTVSLMTVALKGAMMGFSFFKRTGLAKRISDKIHDAASKVTKKLPENMRNKVHKGICTVTGHPVEIATGKVFTELVDFELPGPIPLLWERTWYSVSTHKGESGHGWHHAYDLSLSYNPQDDNLAVRLTDGRNVFFNILEEGEEAFNRQEKLWLRRFDTHYELEDIDRLRFHFPCPDVSRNKLDIQHLSQIKNHSDFTIVFERNILGHLTHIIDSAGRKLNISSDKEGRILQIEAPHPEKRGEFFTLIAYHYDEKGNLIKSTDALGASFKYVYQGHLLVKETNRNGLSFQFSYDGTDEYARCLRTWGDGGIYDHKLSYHLEKQYTIVENSLGHKTHYYWNEDGVVYKTRDPLGHEAITKYGNFSQIVSKIDELDRVTYYQYDELGNKTAIFHPDGTTIQLSYEGTLLVAAIDQIGGNWQWQYNDEGQLIARTDPQGNTSQYDYENGLLSSFLDVTGKKTSLGYDKYHNLTTLVTPDGARSEWKYDALGRCTIAIDPKGNIQKRKFNFMGWVRRVNEPDGNIRELEYDAEGNVTRAKDKQHDVRFEYAGMDRLKARTEAKTRVEFKYNTEEDLLGIINEHGYAYRFELDERGDVVTESGFDGLKRIYKRDAGGQVATVARASGMLTQYKYDLQGRVTALEHSDGSREQYAYREDGELIEANNNHIKVAFERDELGRVLKETQGDFAVNSEYDTLGLRSRLHSSLGANIEFTRNQMGDVEQVVSNTGKAKGWSASFQHDIMGLELDRQLPGGIRSQWKRDRLGRPTEQKFSTGGKVTRTREYEWGVNDRLKQIADDKKGVTKFEHDVFGNLASAQYGDGSFEFRTPDAVGNLFRKQDQSDRKYGPAGQLLEADGRQYEYDVEGNLIKKTEQNGGIWQYSWNAAGMLSKVLRPDGFAITFEYDALGRRISKTYRNKTTRWVWDGNVILHEWVAVQQNSFTKTATPSTSAASAFSIKKRDTQLATAPANAPPTPIQNEATASIAQPAASELTTWLFEPESFSPLAKLSEHQQYGIVTDHLGTPVSMYDEAGEEVWQMDLSIYGEVRNLDGWREACPFRYPGQYEDVETGLYYNRFRYYDAEGGFYISQDPIGLEGGNPNIYGYVWDNNLETDPYGLSCTPPKGYRKTKYRSHGQPVYTNPKASSALKFITPDIDGHNGGVWKGANSIRKLGRKSTRSGTYDVNLNKIGD